MHLSRPTGRHYSLHVRTIELLKLNSCFRNHWIPIGEARALHLCWPMSSAAAHGYLEVVRLLLEAGADQNAEQQDGSTALMAAAQNGHLQVVRVLLEAGADKNAAMQNGATALMMAFSHFGAGV